MVDTVDKRAIDCKVDEKSPKSWKQRLTGYLKELGFIDKGFKGKVIIDVNHGGVRSLDKTEKFE